MLKPLLEVVGQKLTNPFSPDDRWLMPLSVDESRVGTQYTVHLINNCWYRYSDESLPDFIKVKLGRIGAYTGPRLADLMAKNNRFTDSIYVFSEQHMPAEFEIVGWRRNHNLFILSLSTTELHRVFDDTGIQSKSKGKKDTG